MDHKHAGRRDRLIEVLPVSPWPQELRGRGFPLEEIEGGQRILPHAVRVEMTKNADGTLAPLTEGSTQPTTMIVHQPGICQTARFTMLAPFFFSTNLRFAVMVEPNITPCTTPNM